VLLHLYAAIFLGIVWLSEINDQMLAAFKYQNEQKEQALRIS